MSTALRVFTLGARSLRSKCTLEVERWRCSAPGVGVETCLSLPPTLSLPREGGAAIGAADLEFQCRALGFLETVFGTTLVPAPQRPVRRHGSRIYNVCKAGIPILIGPCFWVAARRPAR